MIKDLTGIREFAKQAHAKAGKTYGEEDYVVHLDEVHEWVLKFATDKSISKVDLFVLERSAYGHDLGEDTGMSHRKIKLQFGRREANTIYSVTDENGKDRTDRILKTLSKTRHNRLGILLKMADRAANGSHSKLTGHSMWKRDMKEYVILRFALRKVGQYVPAWEILDELFEYKETV